MVITIASSKEGTEQRSGRQVMKKGLRATGICKAPQITGKAAGRTCPTGS